MAIRKDQYTYKYEHQEPTYMHQLISGYQPIDRPPNSYEPQYNLNDNQLVSTWTFNLALLTSKV